MSNSVQVSGSVSLVSATVATAVSYALSVSSMPVNGGTTSPSGINNYPAGAKVQVTATPASNSSLLYWLLDGNNMGNMNPITVTMDKSHELVAVFAVRGPGSEGLAFSAAIALSETAISESVGTV